jgi:GTP-binding protein
MTFQVNKSPFAGKEGKYLTSRQIRARLEQELLHNVALRVEYMDDPDKFRVSGRGELHLSVLIENMRREGYELAVSRPAVIEKTVDGVVQEPWEQLTVDFADQYQGGVMTRLAERKGELISMTPDGRGRVRLEYRIPARGLIGFRTEFLTETRGTGQLHHVLEGFEPWHGEIRSRQNGSLIADRQGVATEHALMTLQERGELFIEPGIDVYNGMIVGLNARSDDMEINPTREKKLTNMRAASAEELVRLTPPRHLSLEQALEFIAEDECVEVTPDAVRLRKVELDPNLRRRLDKAKKGL